jgi:hypothetical protein
VVAYSDEDALLAGDEDSESGDLPDWQGQQADLVKAIDGDEGGRFVPLPDKFDVNEWDMMRDFATSQKDDRLAEDLLRAIQGRGAFRYFKDRIHDAGVEKQWYEFRDAQYRQIALNWCEAEKIEVDANA